MNRQLIVTLMGECDEFTPTHWYALKRAINDKAIEIETELYNPQCVPVGVKKCIDFDKSITNDNHDRQRRPIVTPQSILIAYCDKYYFAGINCLSYEPGVNTDSETNNEFLEIFNDVTERFLNTGRLDYDPF